MSFQFVANLILVLCVLGILVIFLRRIPEVVEEKGQLQFARPRGTVEGDDDLDAKALLKTIVDIVKSFFVFLGKHIWHFMLEAKDLKQSQILASKFASFVKPKGRVINIGAFNSIKKADRLMQDGKLDEAEQTYIQVIRKHHLEFSAYEGLIKLYFKQKKYDDITEILEFLVSHNPENDMYLAQLGNVYLSTRRFKDAVEAYTKSLALNSLVPARFVNLGLALQGVGDAIGAKVNFEKAVDLDPSNMQYLMILTDTLVKLGERETAMEYLKSANERDPENVEVKEKLISLEESKTQA
jgi:tetratricopeptide (TPR) repeat protein